MFRFLKRLFARFTRPVYTYPAGDPAMVLTDGNATVHVALTPEQARYAHDRAMAKGLPDLAALVEPMIPYGGKVTMTVQQRSLVSRLLRTNLAVAA